MAEENKPNLIVDETALPAWWKYVEGHPGADTVALIVEQHRKHLAETLNLQSMEHGGLFLTDIPNLDLTVLEVRFGKSGSMALYSRKEASQVAGLILDILGAKSETRH